MAGIKLILAAVTLAMAVSVNSEPLGRLARRAVLLDENFAPIASIVGPQHKVEEPNLMRQRRDTGYAPPVHHGTYKRGKVGPVYTFVKTDYNSNFKWGVRHRAGSQYAGGYH
ncbi:uncharacterized protein LOC135216025 isoform X1 [Macrobrachium nipponense]|uniref:uncharacterized protein LOC135216025 isoform X1 n=1 Tax=Macrobrachium nipponense TaxID=159736 RepID=UPI0030C87470